MSWITELNNFPVLLLPAVGNSNFEFCNRLQSFLLILLHAMKDSIFNSSEKSSQTIVREMKDLISSEEGIKPESRMKMFELLQQVDFVLGKYDIIYEQLIDVFSAMGMHDFSRRIPNLGVDHDFINFITLGINMVNEQLSDTSILKSVTQRIIETMDVKNLIIIVTDTNGDIFLVNSNSNQIPGLCQEALDKIKVHSIFDDFNIIEKRIKAEGSLYDMPVKLKWRGEKIPVILTVAIVTCQSKIDGIIYAIRSGEL